MNSDRSDQPNRVIVFGASGTIGSAVIRALTQAGFEGHGFLRRSAENKAIADDWPEAANAHFGDVIKPQEIAAVMQEARPHAVISCLASRTGAPGDADAIDFQANLDVLDAAEAAGAKQFVLLSAICVQKPRLAFQHAKLRFERRLQVSGLTWSIVRPTAFFKSLSGQVSRVRAGKPFLLFGDGQLTRCKPISDDDLARYLVECLSDQSKHGQILPIGGPGPAISLREQGDMLFELAGMEPRFRKLSPSVFKVLAAMLAPLAAISDWVAAKREYLRIAYYYATESMLAWDSETGAYSADNTPEYGSDTLEAHYREMLNR